MNPPKQRLFVTGASGFLAWNLCQLARGDWDIYGTYYSHPIEIPGVHCVKIDLRELPQLKSLFQDIKPAAVIHAAAQSSPNFCQLYPQESYSINVTTAWNLAELCAEAEIPCIFTSTDLVFNGLNPPYQETDPVCPISYYGEQKVMAELGMLERYPLAAICRMPLMFGVASPSSTSFVQPFIKTLRDGQELSLFTDEFRTPVSGKTAATGLLLALKTGGGYWHLGGQERISRYEFGCVLAEVLKLPKDLLKTCRQTDVKMAAPRPKDVSLDSSKAVALGYKTLSIRDELAALQHLIE